MQDQNLTMSGKIMKDKHVRRWTELCTEQMLVRLDKRKKLEDSG